jgi:sec-independent protein translocase protein TatB
MFGMGIGEILVVLFIALIFLGPERIPSTARTLGKWFHEIKGSLDGIRDAFEKDMKESPKADEKNETGSQKLETQNKEV